MKTIGIISGYFDCLHEGHLNYIEDARNRCDQLIVIVNNDKQALLKKGFFFQDQNFRVRLITHIYEVYTATISIDEDLTVNKTLEKIFNWYPPKKERDKEIPIVQFKFLNGGDVKDGCREEEICKKYGCELVYDVGGLKTASSTDVLQRFGEWYCKSET